MNYNELKKIVATDKEISKKIYICNFLTCNTEKMKNTKISLVRNLLGKYIVTLCWIMNMVNFQSNNLLIIRIWPPIMLGN